MKNIAKQLRYLRNNETNKHINSGTGTAVELIKQLNGMLDEMLNAWKQVREIPEYPGSYYVTRSIYQSFWNVINDNKNSKDMLMKYGVEANDEIERKWQQYQNR